MASRLALLLLLIGSQAFAQPEYSIGAPPPWVVAVEPDLAFDVPADKASDGVYDLLTDIQTRLEGDDKTSYAHFAMTAFNVGGLESVANIDISFNPAYQTLTLHSIQVIRNGAPIPKLASAEVRVLQREPELERLIYDGRKTAHVFLDDVRVGDVVEYAYSLRGHNPVFGGRHFGGTRLRWRVPVHHQHGRLLVPAGLALTVDTRHTDLQPAVRTLDGYREYLWEQRDVAPILDEDDVPAWYQPDAQAQWSAFPDWNAVADWAVPLYAVPTASASVRQVIDSIAATAKDDEARLLAALHFVQSQIRYLGVEVGAGSHRPSHPDLVLERRFGDCKDKTLLMLTLLAGLGIDARAALVDSQGTRIVLEELPTPASFDHVIVLARLNGDAIWLDPTRNPQRGTLATLHQPDFAYALVVDPATRELQKMTSALRPAPRRTVHTVLDSTAGFQAPAMYTVTTVSEGGAADTMRGTLASTSLPSLQNDYLSFYASRYPDIRTAAALEVTDEDARNRVTVVERYEIENLWRRSDTAERLEANVGALDMLDRMPSLGSTKRSSPLAVPYPLEVSQITEVLLPEPWPVNPTPTTIEDPAFTFTRSIEVLGERIVFTDSLRTHVDHVAAEDVPRYLANLKRARSVLGYALYLDDAAPRAWFERFNWTVALIGVLLVVVYTGLASRLYRWDPRPPSGPVDPGLRGIDGWLVLPAIGAMLGPPVVLYLLFDSLATYELEQWSWLTNYGSDGYHPLWEPVLLYSLAANLAHLVFSVLLALLFFQKRRSAPTVYMAVLAGSVVTAGIDVLLIGVTPGEKTDPEAVNTLVSQMISFAVWWPYFRVSRRVRSTFTKTYAAPAPEALPAQTPPLVESAGN